MNNVSKETKVNNIINKLKRITIKSIESNKIEKAYASLASCASLLYAYNQRYCDDELESYVLKLSSMLFEKNSSNYTKNKDKKIILFYDGFGLDTRGLALIYLKAIIKTRYKLIYVVDKKSKNLQPEIQKALLGYDVEWVYIDGNNGGKYIQLANQLNSAFEKYNPTDAFLYTNPYDVAAISVFEHYRGIVTRYQINLTDHAFWLGKNTFEYCVEFRDVGSKISHNYRKIDKDKLVMLPFYAIVDQDVEFEGFPFNADGFEIVFSGGALYKTLGDKENKYYVMVEELLRKYNNIIFLYAGYGDDTQLLKIIEKYPNRAFYIKERKDLFQVMKHSIFYLNTYPLCGGLMMNYAVTAGKLPLTLRHNNDMDGILFKQSELGIEFSTMQELLEEVERLLNDKQYRFKKENAIKDSIITQQRFEENVKMLLEEGKTEFYISIEEINTEESRKEYLSRFDYNKEVDQIIAQKVNMSLFWEFPICFIRKIIKKIYVKLRR